MNKNPAAISSIEGRALPLRGNDIDTDRIIPARFLRCITFEGLGEQVFRDERYGQDGVAREHPFNDPRYQDASILLVNRNFGCGSSREHAPQALKRFGIQAIIGESFAEIFAGNCTSLGIPVFTAAAAVIEALQRQAESLPETTLRLDLTSKTITSGEVLHQADMADSARTALLAGTWDSLEELQRNEAAIEQVYRRLPYVGAFS